MDGEKVRVSARAAFRCGRKYPTQAKRRLEWATVRFSLPHKNRRFLHSGRNDKLFLIPPLPLRTPPDLGQSIGSADFDRKRGFFIR